MRTLFLVLIAAALSGCVAGDAPDDSALPTDPGAISEPAPGFAPQTGHQEANSDSVSLVGDLYASGCAQSYCIDALATNEGSKPVHISNICVSPWSESMKQRESDVQKSEPMAVCLAWGLREMAPGETVAANFTWDGRLWDADAEEYRDAPQDSYTWSIHFEYYSDADGGEHTKLSLDFPVIVGST